MRATRLLVGMGFAGLAACAEQPLWQSVEVEQSKVTRIDIPIVRPRQLDVLFVIDRSPAMQAFLPVLQKNFRWFINVFETLGGLPSLHLAVTTSDPLDDGAFHVPSGDRVQGGYFVNDHLPDGIRVNNYDGPLSELFAEAASVGATGSASSQPFAMAMRALTTHPGFVRDDADLAIIMITAGDDMSPGTIDDHQRALASLKRDRYGLMVGVAAGPADAACDYDGSIAAPSPRLHALLERFPNRHSFTTLCQQDLTGVLQLFARLGVRVFDPCVEGTVTIERCAGWLQFDDGRPDDVLVPCGTDVGNCFEVVVDPLDCPGASHQRASFHADVFAQRFVMECEVD